jgi:hypothetical protein
VATFEKTARFDKDWADLDPVDKERFRKAVRHFIADLETGKFRPGLRVKRVQGTDAVFEMTFAPDGRATWQYGEELQPGLPHVIWRRIGTHDVLTRPPGP